MENPHYLTNGRLRVHLLLNLAGDVYFISRFSVDGLVANGQDKRVMPVSDDVLVTSREV